MNKYCLSLFLILVLLLMVLTGCNQAVTETGPHDQDRIYQYPETLEVMEDLYQEQAVEFESFATNIMKNITAKTHLDIKFFDTKRQYQYWTSIEGDPFASERQSISTLEEGEEILRFISAYPVAEVRAKEEFITIYLYDVQKYDGHRALNQYRDFKIYHYRTAGGLLLEKEDMDKTGVWLVLNDYWWAEDPSLADYTDYEKDEYGYLNYSINILEEDGFEVKEAVISAFELPQLGLAYFREEITGSVNAKADYLFEINKNCLLLSYERNMKVTALLLNPNDGSILAEHRFSIPTNAAGTYRIQQLSDQLWVYAPRFAKGNEQLFIPFLFTETGIVAQPTIRLPKEAASWIDGKVTFLTDESGIYRIAYITSETESLVIQNFANGQVQGEPTRYDLQMLGLQQSTQLKDIAYLGEQRLVFSWTGNTDSKGGVAEYSGYGFLDPLNEQVQRIPFGGTNLLISGKRLLVANTLDFRHLRGGVSVDTTNPEDVRELHQIYLVHETGEPIVIAHPALSYMLDLEEGFQTQQVAVSVNGFYSIRMGYAFAFFDTNTRQWQKEILKLPEIYPVTRDFSGLVDSDRRRFVATLSATGKKIYILGNYYDETLEKYTGYPLLITAQFP